MLVLRRPLPLLLIAALAVGAAGFGRTRVVRRFPAWRVTAGAEARRGCVEGRAWVSKSGKSGLGLTVRLTLAEGAGTCAVALDEVTLEVGEVRASRRPGEAGRLALGPDRAVAHVYVPLAFDNEDLWNRGLRRGRLQVSWTVAGEPAEPWLLEAEHVLEGGVYEERPWGEPCAAELEELELLETEAP